MTPFSSPHASRAELRALKPGIPTLTTRRYVATDRDGVAHDAGPGAVWALPTRTDGTWNPGTPTRSATGSLVLRNASALLSSLEKRIFIAETDDEGTEAENGELRVSSARLMRSVHWDVETAATFALDCVDHVLGDAASATLADGTTLREVIDDARQIISKTGSNGERRIGLLSRFAAMRRLRRRGESIGDLALSALVEDNAQAQDSIEDPAWATLAALGDGVLAALEAVRHHALPRYVASREATLDEHDDGTPTTNSPIVVTPWGPVALGAEHRSPFEPAWVAARDAAGRARAAVADTRGESAEAAERAWQAAHLEELFDRP